MRRSDSSLMDEDYRRAPWGTRGEVHPPSLEYFSPIRWTMVARFQANSERGSGAGRGISPATRFVRIGRSHLLGNCRRSREFVPENDACPGGKLLPSTLLPATTSHSRASSFVHECCSTPPKSVARSPGAALAQAIESLRTVDEEGQSRPPFADPRSLRDLRHQHQEKQR